MPGIKNAPDEARLESLDSETGDNRLKEVPPKVGLRNRLSAANTSPQRISVIRPPPLSQVIPPSDVLETHPSEPALSPQLAHQDIRRASEIKAALELDGVAVSISTALNPKEPLRRKGYQLPEEGENEALILQNEVLLVTEASTEVISRPATAASTGQLPMLDNTSSRPVTAAKPVSMDAGSRTGTPSNGKKPASAASPSPSTPAKRPESRSKSPGGGQDEGGGKAGKKGKKGKKGGKKGKKVAVEGPEPNLSLLRVGGPIAPFLPGLVRGTHPEQWAGNSRRTADALIRLNPAGEGRAKVH